MNHNPEASTVFVVDDDDAVRSSLRELLSAVSLPVETFASGEDFLKVYRAERPGCLVLDLRLKDANGLDVQDELLRREAHMPIIVLTGHGDVPASVRALKAGAFDFLQKPPLPSVLLDRIRAALSADRSAREVAAGRADALDRLKSLTPRERDVMSLLVGGATSKEAASDLGISVRTVEGHRRRVLSKLDVTSAAQLVRLVMITRGADGEDPPRPGSP
jgi:two-component system response regulator FixJ